MQIVPALQGILANSGLHVDARTWLLLFFLIFARLIAALVLIPFMGGSSVSSQIKAGLAAVISCVLISGIARTAGPLPASPLVYFALVAKEVAVGIMFGYITQLIFYGVQIAGVIIDTQRGLNQITYLAPELPGNTSALGAVQLQISIVLFLVIGGHLRFFRSFAESYQTVPLLQMPHLSNGWFPLAIEFIRISASALLIGAELAAPVVLTIFLVDVAFGCIGKVASSIKVGNDSNTAKSWLGLAVFILTVAFFLERLQQFLLSSITALESVARSLR